MVQPETVGQTRPDNLEKQLSDLYYENGMILLDGGMGTQLEALGAPVNDNPLWSALCLLHDKAMVKQIHREYLDAGAQILTTATYQATTDQLSANGVTDFLDFYQQSVTIAQEAIAEYNETQNKIEKKLVAFSIGPYGSWLLGGQEFGGDYGVSVEYLINFHSTRLKLAAQLTSVDLIAFETVPCKKEVIAIIKLLQDFPKVRAWIGISCRDSAHANDGTPIEEIAKLVNDSKQIIAVGINCTSPEFAPSLIQKIFKVTNKYVIAYPNKGEDWDNLNKCWKANTEKCAWLNEILSWKEMGASIVGGCCRTTPADIKTIANQLQKIKPKNLKNNEF